MSQKNNHARSKQKRKKLRLKNLLQSIWQRKIERAKPEPPKQKPLVGKAKKAATHVSDLYPVGGYHWDYFFPGSNHGRNLNQRQKRKQRRQQPHGHK